MRYLMIGIALLAMTASFAADVLSDTGSGVVSLTVEKFVSISDAPGVPLVLSGNGQTGSASLVFPYVTNCPASISAAITASTTTTGAIWAITAGGGPAGVVAPGGSHTVTVGVSSAAQLTAGTDSATVTATITAS